MPRQLTFDLPAATEFGADSFFVSGSNRAAHDLVTGPLPWPQGKLVLAGPRGAGKTHLARIWQARTGGTLVAAADVAALPRPGADARLVVEDLHLIPPEAEEPLFHLHNLLAATGGLLLMTADRPPARIGFRLPDLASRMQATAVAQIGDPDDPLLFAVLTKLFADRQLAVQPALLPWLVARMPRSFAAARAIVAELDARSLAEARPITLRLAAEILDMDAPEW